MAILVSTRMRGTPLVRHIPSAKYVFLDTPYDFQPNSELGVFLLSDASFPEDLGRRDGVRKVVIVEMQENTPLFAIEEAMLRRSVQMLISYSPEESAQYIVSLQTKNRERLRNTKGSVQKAMSAAERKYGEPIDQREIFLSKIPKVTIRDGMAILAQTKTLAQAFSLQSLTQIEGVGEKKSASFAEFANNSFAAARFYFS
jgi:ERCC4-type nuclease